MRCRRTAQTGEDARFHIGAGFRVIDFCLKSFHKFILSCESADKSSAPQSQKQSQKPRTRVSALHKRHKVKKKGGARGLRLFFFSYS